MASGRIVAAIKSLVNARGLQLQFARVLEWKEERPRIRAVQMDNYRGLMSIKRIDKIPNARIKELSE